MNKPKIGVIFAMDETGGIGIHGELPWTHHAEDFKQFRHATMGKPMVMGRRTFDSLPGILTGRDHMVITSNPDTLPEHEQVYSARDLQDAIDQYPDVDFVWCIGGKRVIEEAAKFADVIRITTMFSEYVCDTIIDADVIQWIKDNAVRTVEVVPEEINSGYWITEYHMNHE